MRRNRRDENEPALFKVARRLGAIIEKQGPLDAWVNAAGEWFPVEVKDPKRLGDADEFEPTQLAFMSRCQLQGAKFRVWRTADDVVRDCGWRKA